MSDILTREEWDEIARRLREPFDPGDVDFRVQGKASEQTGKAQVVARRSRGRGVGRGFGGGRKPVPLAERFAKKYTVLPNGCWKWTGYMMPNGYPGGFSFGKRGEGRDYGHRVAYLLAYGPIPTGCEIDHLCRHRYCVNPAHLEAVPHRENLMRADGPSALCARKTVCKRGHAFTPENTTIKKDGSRVCRTCRRERDRQHWPERRDKRNERKRLLAAERRAA